MNTFDVNRYRFTDLVADQREAKRSERPQASSGESSAVITTGMEQLAVSSHVLFLAPAKSAAFRV